MTGSAKPWLGLEHAFAALPLDGLAPSLQQLWKTLHAAMLPQEEVATMHQQQHLQQSRSIVAAATTIAAAEESNDGHDE